MNITANMLVATASRVDIPTRIMTGTLISEWPPVIAHGPVSTMRAVSRARSVGVTAQGQSTRRSYGRGWAREGGCVRA